MNCIVCGAPTDIKTGYALPFIRLTAVGEYQNLYACSSACRDEWRDAQREVKQIQAELSTDKPAPITMGEYER